MNGIQIDHSCKEYISRRLLTQKTQDVILHWNVLATSTAMDLAFLLGVGDEDWRMQIDSHTRQIWPQKVAGKCLLGTSFSKQVEAHHQWGPPPMTFFSQTSPRLYSSSHVSNFIGSGRVNWDSLPERSTTITFS